jgi:hypothetical protein
MFVTVEVRATRLAGQDRIRGFDHIVLSIYDCFRFQPWQLTCVHGWSFYRTIAPSSASHFLHTDEAFKLRHSPILQVVFTCPDSSNRIKGRQRQEIFFSSFFTSLDVMQFRFRETQAHWQPTTCVLFNVHRPRMPRLTQHNDASSYQVFQTGSMDITQARLIQRKFALLPFHTELDKWRHTNPFSHD